MSIKKRFFIIFVLFLIIPLQVIADNHNVLRLATTTSVENSGLLDHLLPFFSKEHPYELNVTVLGSGSALKMGRSGEVDLVWVHSPKAEQKFVDDGFGINHKTVMHNNFVLAGPSDDPARIANASDAFEALKRIQQTQQQFVSRGDDSGTNKKEIGLWQQMMDDYPAGEDWYLETGTGMAKSLATANEQNAYILIDKATFMVRKYPNQSLLLEDNKNLSNPYSVIAVNPDKFKHINAEGAITFIDWLSGPDGQQAIAGFIFDNEQLYFPASQ